MKRIAFIDTETSEKPKQIKDIGAIKDTGDEFHSNHILNFKHFIKDVKYLCGHNIIEHDLKYLSKYIDFNYFKIIDTLYWSPLLFPARPYHSLLKDDKLQTEELNNPLNDAIKARDLFFDEVEKFNNLDNGLKQIYFRLLHKSKYFKDFFILLIIIQTLKQNLNI